MGEELKPCPFCGGGDIREDHNMRNHFEEIFCDDCGAKVSIEGIHSDAVAAWNRRAALSVMAEPDGWQPMTWRQIASAPKNASPFILVFCPAFEGFVALASWQGRGEEAQWYGVDQDGLRYQQRAAEPTHWMPLPGPPALQTEGN